MNEEQLISEVLHGEAAADSSRYALYENGTYMVISKFAYLIGVPTRIFEKMSMSRLRWSGTKTPAGQECPHHPESLHAAHSVRAKLPEHI